MIMTLTYKEQIMKRITSILLLLFCAVTFQYLYASGGNRTGSGGAAELLIPTGARDLAMGGATISTTSGIDALFWNPAGIANAKSSVNMMFSHMSYIADIGVSYGAVSANFEGIGTFAFSVKSLSIGEMLVTTTLDPDGTGQTYTPQYFVAGLTFAKQLSDKISVGVTANLISERIAEVSTSGTAFNVGVKYENLANVNGLSLGVAVKNIGPQLKFEGPGLYQQGTVANQNRSANFVALESAPFELPSTFEFGLGYKYTMEGNSALLVSGTFQNNNFSGDEYKGGLEYGYNNNFFARVGYTGSPANQNPDYIYGFTAGAGIAYPMEGVEIAFDYAYRSVKYFDGNHTISIRLGF
jgi:hypothetical protein